MHLLKTSTTAAVLAAAASPALAGPVRAATGKQSAPKREPEESTFDKIWDVLTLYKNDQNDFVQLFKLRGRYHGQYHWTDSDQGDDDGWEDRRFRLGIEGRFFHQLDLVAEFESTDEFDPFYNRLTDVYLHWKPSETFTLKVGKQKPQIAWYDWLQSTNAQPTFERSQIFNQLGVDRVPGVVVSGKADHFTYQAGIYSNAVDQEFGGFDGGISYGAGIGYDLKDAFHFDKADWRLDWIHSDFEAEDTFLNRYEDLFSTTLWLKDGRWSLVAEAFYATGGRPDAFGFYIQPTYDLIAKKLQLVGRYSFSNGSNDALTAQSRYERAVPDITDGGRGGQYNAAYLGLQYFIYGDKLKLLAGVEYANLDGGGDGGDFDGFTVLTGVRFSF